MGNIKNVVGLAVAVVFFLLIIKFRSLVYLMNTVFGRLLLILFILGITCINRILGVVSVLLIIILCNESGLASMEGFQTQHEVKVSKGIEPLTKKVGREGFNMVEREGLMMRGKQSKSVPVTIERSGEVDPVDSSSYSSTFASI